MRHLRSLGFGLLLLLALPPRAQADVALSVGFSDPEFIAYFRQAILARTLPGHDDRPGRLARFSGPVRLLVVNATEQSDPALASLVEQVDIVADQIHAASGLTIEVTKAFEDAAFERAMKNSPRPNLILSFGIVPSSDNFDPTTKRQLDIVTEARLLVAPCKGDQCRSAVLTAFRGGQDILAGAISVEPTDPAYARAAVTEALLRAVTDAAAVDAVYPSVLGWHRDAPFDRRGLSRMDRLMLRIVYDPHLTADMTSTEIEAQLPALLAAAKAAAGE